MSLHSPRCGGLTHERAALSGAGRRGSYGSKFAPCPTQPTSSDPPGLLGQERNERFRILGEPSSPRNRRWSQTRANGPWKRGLRRAESRNSSWGHPAEDQRGVQRILRTGSNSWGVVGALCLARPGHSLLPGAVTHHLAGDPPRTASPPAAPPAARPAAPFPAPWPDSGAPLDPRALRRWSGRTGGSV